MFRKILRVGKEVLIHYDLKVESLKQTLQFLYYLQ